jgi:hypothetical protein
MALDTFRFTMSLPAGADPLPLVREVCGRMAHYLGLPDDRAHNACEMLEQAVAERLRQPGVDARPIRVTFDRPSNGSMATVEVTWDVPEGAPDEGHGGSRFSWQVHDTE